jgi:hypothetical protein
MQGVGHSIFEQINNGVASLKDSKSTLDRLTTAPNINVSTCFTLDIFNSEIPLLLRIPRTYNSHALRNLLQRVNAHPDVLS